MKKMKALDKMDHFIKKVFFFIEKKQEIECEIGKTQFVDTRD
jgi:hypothetical protein